MIAALVLAAGGMADPTPLSIPRWRLFECPSGLPCQQRGKDFYSEKTACELDATGLAILLPKGSRTICERIKK